MFARILCRVTLESNLLGKNKIFACKTAESERLGRWKCKMRIEERLKTKRQMEIESSYRQNRRFLFGSNPSTRQLVNLSWAEVITAQ